MLLALDVSTKCIGWCVLDAAGALSGLGYLWLDKLTTEQRLDALEVFLQDLTKDTELCKIFVEAPLQRSNNQNVVNILQRWNGMVCAYTYKVCGMMPELITEVNARKASGIKIPKGVKGTDKKKYVLRCMIEQGFFPESKIELKRTGNYKDWCYDMADSIVVARAGYLK